MYTKIGGREDRIVFTPHHSLTAQNLALAMRGVLQSIPKIEKDPRVSLEKVVTLEEMISSLHDRVQKAMHLSFKEFAGIGKKQKVHIIVSFLAMLELVKNGIIEVRQELPTDDIAIQPVYAGAT